MTDAAARAREVAESCDHVLATKTATRVINKWQPIRAACEDCIARALADAEQVATREARTAWKMRAEQVERQLIDAEQRAERLQAERLSDIRKVRDDEAAKRLAMQSALSKERDELERHLADARRALERAAKISSHAHEPWCRECDALWSAHRPGCAVAAALATPPPGAQCRPANHPDDCEPTTSEVGTDEIGGAQGR